VRQRFHKLPPALPCKWQKLLRFREQRRREKRVTLLHSLSLFLTCQGRAQESGKWEREIDDGDFLDCQPDALHVDGQVRQQRGHSCKELPLRALLKSVGRGWSGVGEKRPRRDSCYGEEQRPK
jgi:hypothetical protein